MIHPNPTPDPPEPPGIRAWSITTKSASSDSSSGRTSSQKLGCQREKEATQLASVGHTKRQSTGRIDELAGVNIRLPGAWPCAWGELIGSLTARTGGIGPAAIANRDMDRLSALLPLEHVALLFNLYRTAWP